VAGFRWRGDVALRFARTDTEEAVKRKPRNGLAMIGKLRQAWVWFVDGLVEALLWAIDRAARARPHRLEIADAEAVVVGPDGSRMGRLLWEEGGARFEPPDLGRRLTGAAVDVIIPAAWQFRRDLEPVAVQSRPFLDAFVRHQIERITPWRVADTHYRVLQHPLAEDANRLAVAVAVVPKRLVARWLLPLDGLHPRSIRLRTAGCGDAENSAISIGGGPPRLAAPLRRAVIGGLVVLALGTAVIGGWLQWQAGTVRDAIDEQDRVLGERRAVLARAQRQDHPGGDAAAKLRTLRDSRPMAVAVIDALSAAMPDSAYLTSLSIDKDHVTISGLTTDPSRLVPMLESSGSFADVSFGAATTRVEAGGGDRFSLEMKAEVPRPATSTPTADIAPAGAVRFDSPAAQARATP